MDLSGHRGFVKTTGVAMATSGDPSMGFFLLTKCVCNKPRKSSISNFYSSIPFSFLYVITEQWSVLLHFGIAALN